MRISCPNECILSFAVDSSFLCHDLRPAELLMQQDMLGRPAVPMQENKRQHRAACSEVRAETEGAGCCAPAAAGGCT